MSHLPTKDWRWPEGALVEAETRMAQEVVIDQLRADRDDLWAALELEHSADDGSLCWQDYFAPGAKETCRVCALLARTRAA